MKTHRVSHLVFFLLFFIFSGVQASLANNLTVSNVRMGLRDTGAKTLSIFFDIAWDNSWKNKINHDAVWVNVRLSDQQSVEKKICILSTAGIDPAGAGSGTNTDLEIFVPADKTGAFLRRRSNSPSASFSSKNVMLTINYAASGFDESSQTVATVFGLEMVFIPQGAFYAGDFAAGRASFRRGSGDENPWHIQGEAAISVENRVADVFYYSSAGNPDEFATGASFIVPENFPKGFSPFYAMKYEINEGNWVDFINSLHPAARARLDLTDNFHKGSDSVLSRNTVACSGSPLICSTQRPFRALGYLNWHDLCAYLDWAGLRPMSELEFEKMARGPFLPVKNEYSWGTTGILPVLAISGTTEQNGDETVATTGANARFGSGLLNGGDSSLGFEFQGGPLRCGIFATPFSSRELSGAGAYGVMELSGNIREQVVTLGNSYGLQFTAQHGDGRLVSLPGVEGNADVPFWPGTDIDTLKGVTGALGSGIRGGSWADTQSSLTISDRAQAAMPVVAADNLTGGRGVRTYDGQ